MREGFTKNKIKKIGKVFSGATPKTENESFWNGEILWITPNDLSKIKSSFFSDTERKITSSGLNSCSARLLPVNSIVLSSRAPIGYIAIGEKEFTTNQGCKSIVLNDNHDALFFYYNLNSYVLKLKQLGEGTTFAEISKTYLEEFEIEFPIEKAEQTRIAEILSTADKAIAQTEALIAKYQRIKTGLMQDLLNNGIDASGNIRSKETHKFVVKNGIEVPEGWEVNPLRTYLKYISYGFTNPMPETAEGPFMVTAANINEGKIIYKGCRHTSWAAYNSLLTTKSKPQIDDILITKDGSLGRLAIVHNEEICINQSVAVLRIDKELVNVYFLKMLLESPYYQAVIIGDAGGSTIKHIYITKLDKMNIAIPKKIDEQIKILQLIEEQSIYIYELQRELLKYNSIKTGLMQDLLSGKVRVNMDNKN